MLNTLIIFTTSHAECMRRHKPSFEDGFSRIGLKESVKLLCEKVEGHQHPDTDLKSLFISKYEELEVKFEKEEGNLNSTDKEVIRTRLNSIKENLKIPL